MKLKSLNIIILYLMTQQVNAAGSFFNDLENKIRESSNELADMLGLEKEHSKQNNNKNDVISKIEILGNSELNPEKLLEILENIGVKEGSINDKNNIENAISKLKEMFKELGYPHSEISYVLTEDNALEIKIISGDAEILNNVTIEGNKRFSQEEIIKEIELDNSGIFSWLTGDDKFNSIKLNEAIIKLQNLYFNTGYADFKVLDVSTKKNNNKVDIKIKIKEGETYQVDKIGFIVGDALDLNTIKNIANIKNDITFDRSKVINGIKNIKNYLSNKGYPYVKINTTPQIAGKGFIDLIIKVEAGNTEIIHDISPLNNKNTKDYVITREFNKVKGKLFNQKNIDEAIGHLRRSGLFIKVDYELKKENEQNILYVKVKEAPTGSINAGVSFSQIIGFQATAGVGEKNLWGTGRSVNANIGYSANQQDFSLFFSDPVINEQRHSVSGRVYYNMSNEDFNDINTYDKDSMGFNVRYGIPISDYSKFYIGGGIDNSNIICAGSFEENCDDVGGFTYLAKLGWSYDNRDNYYLAKSGETHQFDIDWATPISDNNYIKAKYKGSYHKGLTDDLYGKISTTAGYASNDVPFYERYKIGGVGSVRGYLGNSIGEKYSDNTPKGGNLIFTTSAEVRKPIMTERMDGLVFGAFVDAGVLGKDFDSFTFNDTKYSAGVLLDWTSPVGPLSFSYGIPINPSDDDIEEKFQFSFGMPF